MLTNLNIPWIQIQNKKKKKDKNKLNKKKTVALGDTNFSIIYICHKESL